MTSCTPASARGVTAARQVGCKRSIAGQEKGMKIARRTLLAVGLTGLAWSATRGLAAAPNSGTRFVFHVSSHGSSIWGDLLDWVFDRGYPPLLGVKRTCGLRCWVIGAVS